MEKDKKLEPIITKEPATTTGDCETSGAQTSGQRQNSTTKKSEMGWINSVPHCLLVRSGFWGSFLAPMFTGTFTCLTQTPNTQDPHFIAWTTLTAILTILAGARTSSQLKKAKEDIKSIQYEMREYLKDSEYSLDLSQARNFPNMTSILVRHITKHNPGVFDRFIENPKSIPDNVTMQDVISAHLDKHSDAAPKILEALEQIKVKSRKVRYDEPEPYEDTEEVLPVSYELRKRLERRARRAKMAEVCH